MKRDFVSQVDNMTGSPKLSHNERRHILDARIDTGKDLGSAWDAKIHAGTGLTYRDLRYKIGKDRHEHPWKTVGSLARSYGVSVGFVCKWSRVYRAYREANEERPGSVARDVFRSVTNRPPEDKMRRTVPWDVRRFIVETRIACPFLGSRKLRI